VIKKEISKELVSKARETYIGDIGDNALYRMCEEYPEHTDKNAIVSKIWLIGRSYAADIVRTKRKPKDITADDFYKEFVYPKMLEIGAELDGRIAELNQVNEITPKSLPEISRTHKLLVDSFYSVTGQVNTSLASKYLHFHAPNMFYIYDSYADKSATGLSSGDKKIEKLLQGGDARYIKHLARLYDIQEYIKKEYSIPMTPREIDRMLVFC
jgi:hypothetical protein